MQGYVHAKPSEAAGVLSRLADCVASIGTYCDSRHLQLNSTKTEVMWFGTAANLQKMEVKDRRLPVRGVMVEPVEVVRNLGVYFDSRLTMQQHVSNISRTCFYHLRRLRSLRKQIGREPVARLVSAFVLLRLDYCNAIFAGLPSSTLAPLQRVQNAAARLVLDLKCETI